MFILFNFYTTNAQVQNTSITGFSKKSDPSVLTKKDTVAQKKDSSAIQLKEAKRSEIKTTVVYSSDDSIRLDVTTNEVFMFGNSKITYGDINLAADKVKMNWKKNVMDAEGTPDSATGKVKGDPVFKQGKDVYNASKIQYNFKTKKGIISGIVTQQGEGYIHGEKVKKNQYDEMFVKDAKYTTCNREHPHFYINASKVKMVPGNKIVTGPFNMVIEDVPLPLGFVLGLFPLPKTKSAGIIIPTYGESTQQGFFLQNGGFYIPISEYVRIRTTGNVWTVGSYGVQSSITYKWKYNFSGNLSFTYNYRVNPNFIAERTPANSRDWWLYWTHTPETNGRGSTFSASVSMGSNGFNRNNSFNMTNALASNFTSSIIYSKSFKGTPFNMSISAQQTQNVLTKIETYNLPDIAINMNRQSPFQNLTALKAKEWDFVKKLNIAYNFGFKNNFTNANRFLDTLTNKPIDPLNSLEVLRTPLRRDTSSYFSGNIAGNEFWSRMNNGFQHNIPISTTIKLLKHFSLNPTFNLRSVWYGDYLKWESLKGTRSDGTLYDSLIYSTRVNEFKAATNYNVNVGLTTRFYGTFYVKKLGIEAIRHSVIPTISYSYAPNFADPRFRDFWGGGVQQFTNINGNPVFQSQFGNPRYVYGGTSGGEQSVIGFGINNNFEMKIRDKKDTVKKFKKVSLLDNLSLNGGYNLAAKVNQLSPFQLSARTRILEIIDLNFQSTFDPYQYYENTVTGVRTRSDFYTWNSFGGGNPANQKRWEGNSRFLNLTNMNISLGMVLNPGAFKKLMTKKEEELTEEEKALKRRIKANPESYVDFNMPWNLSVMMNYVPNLGYQGNAGRELLTFNFSGDVNLTPKWKVQFRTTYDVVRKQFAAPSFTIYRDLHCWQMNLTWIPFGFQQMYSMDIGIKASILQDLKYNKRRNDWFDNVGQ